MSQTPVPQNKVNASLVDPGRGEHLWTILTMPRRFHLQRTTDVTGVSGPGHVADGVLWPDGTASVRWVGERPSVVFWDVGFADAEYVHGHGGHTVIVWDDPEPDLEPKVSVCQTNGNPSSEAADALGALAEVAKQQMRDSDPEVLRIRAEAAEATVARTRAFVEDMATWCSPHAVATGYSERILEVMDRGSEAGL